MRRMSVPMIVGTPLLLLLAGGAAGWFIAERDTATNGQDGNGIALPATFDDVAPLDPLNDAPNPLDADASTIIGASAYIDSGAIEVSGGAELEIPVVAGASAVAVDPATLLPMPNGEDVPSPIAPREATVMNLPGASSPTPTAIVREAISDDSVATPNPFRVSTPFAASGALAALCNEIEASNVPDPLAQPATRPTLVVLVNQPSTIAVSGTWSDGSTLEKATMVTLPAHDDEWRRLFEETGEQAAILACLTLPIDEVRGRAEGGVAQLRASVLAISANGQADLNASVTLNVPIEGDDPLFVDRVTLTGRGEQRRLDGVLYPTMHVHYAFLSDAVVPIGSVLQPGQVRVFGDHAFVEGADCAGWAANQQGVDRTHSGRFSVTTATREVSGRDRAVTVVDGDVYLDPTLPGGWEGSFCVRLLATDRNGAQQTTLALRGAQVRSPRTALYEVGVLLNDVAATTGGMVQATWTSASGTGCPKTTLVTGAGAQCGFSARWVPDGIDVQLTLDATSAVIRVPVNTAYCNPDDPLESGDGCNAGFTQTFHLSFGTVTLQVLRSVEPGMLWEDPSNAWSIAPIT